MEKLGKILSFIQGTVSVPVIAQDAGDNNGDKDSFCLQGVCCLGKGVSRCINKHYEITLVSSVIERWAGK